MKFQVFKKFYDLTHNTHNLCLTCFLMMDERNLPCYKFSISSLFFTEDPVFSGALMASEMQETGSTGESPLVASSRHEELLLTELGVRQKKNVCKQQSVMSQRRKGSDQEKQAVAFVCASYISTSSESGRIAAREMNNVEFTTSLPEIKGKLNTASIFWSHVDLVLLSQISY